MRSGRWLVAGLTLAVWSGRAAVAQQEPPPEGEEPPQEAPPQGEAPPPDYPPPADYPPSPQGDSLPPPMPPAEARLGEVGQIAISDDLRLLIARQSVAGSFSTTSYEFDPSVEYFFAPSLSVGAKLAIYHLSSDYQHQTTIGLTPRIGYDFSVSPLVSIWPRLGLGYNHTSVGSGGIGAPDTTGYTIVLDIFVPVVFHPAPHFFIGVGPYLRKELISKVESADASKVTNSGLMSMLGGYFGGS